MSVYAVNTKKIFANFFRIFLMFIVLFAKFFLTFPFFSSILKSIQIMKRR